MADATAMVRAWGKWHAYDATARGSVPLGVPLVIPNGDGWSWTGGGQTGAEGHRPGAVAASEAAMGATGGYVADGNIFAPIIWFGGQGIPAAFTAPPGGALRHGGLA